jgi:hypothetical protein
MATVTAQTPPQVAHIPAPHLQHLTSPVVNRAAPRAITVIRPRHQAHTDRASLNTASKEDTAASNQTTMHPHRSSSITSTAVVDTNNTLPSTSSSMEGGLDNTVSISKKAMVSKLDMGDRVTVRHQTLLQDNMDTILRTVVQATTTTTSTISMAVHHNIPGLRSTSRATEDRLSTVRVTVEHRSRDGSSCGNSKPIMGMCK